MAAEDRFPIVCVMKADDDVPSLDQRLGGAVVVADLMCCVVRRAVNVDRRVGVPVEEVGPREVAGQVVLGVTGQPNAELVDTVEPALFEFAVAAFS